MPPCSPSTIGTHDSGTFALGDEIDTSYDNACPVDPANLPGILQDLGSSTISAYERGWSVAQLADLPTQIDMGEESQLTFDPLEPRSSLQ